MTCNCKQYKLPHMYIKDGDAKYRRDQYAANQGPTLDPWLDASKPALFYTLTDFKAMLAWIKTTSPTADAIRIYFAVYDNAEKPPVPKGYADKFTFLFAPARIVDPSTMKAIDTGKFFTILPPKGPFSSTDGDIDPPIAQRWIRNWVNGPLQELPADETNTNYDPIKDEYTDTKCVVYRSAFLDELMTEADCQQKADPTNVGGFNLYMASYLDNDNKFPSRLSTHFTIANDAGVDSDIDVSCRDEHKFENADTGNPCPPATGCST